MIPFPKPDVEQYFRTYVISQFAVSKDEKRLVFSSNLNGKFNLWAMDLPNTYPYPLTANDESCQFIKIDPNNTFILSGFDHDGDENYQIYALPPSGGEPFPLITGEKEEKYYFASLSTDGERVYYMSSKNNPTFLDIRRRNLRTQTDELLIEGSDGPGYLLATSPNEHALAYIKTFANTYMLGYVNVGEEHLCLTPSPDVVHTVTDIVFANDDELYFVTNYDREFSYVAHFDLTSRTFKPLVHIENEEVKEIKWHKQSGTLYLATEKGVTDKLYAYDVATGELTAMPLPVAIVEQLHVADSGNVYLLGRSATQNFNIYRKAPGEQWTALTENRVLGISPDELIEPEVVHYDSFDGKRIEALLFHPQAGVANGYTVFWPHGGPQWAERKQFRALFQFLLARGYTIFAPNFRGSTCYGASFTKLVEGDWGEGPRLDCVAGIEWLFDQGISDRDKLFVVGGSYGGYMTLLLAGRHPEYFRAAVDIFGPSNLFTFLDSVPEHWKPMMRQWLGDPVEDKERLTKDSPITYLEQMTKPMLVIQGANDPRVVKAESDQIVAALKERGVAAEYLVLEDEGHGFSKKENEIKVNRLILDFLERHQ